MGGIRMIELIIIGFIIYFLLMLWILTPPEIEKSIKHFLKGLRQKCLLRSPE
jgi:fructose-specific phosphotransferase system IIC component